MTNGFYPICYVWGILTTVTTERGNFQFSNTELIGVFFLLFSSLNPSTNFSSFNFMWMGLEFLTCFSFKNFFILVLNDLGAYQPPLKDFQMKIAFPLIFKLLKNVGISQATQQNTSVNKTQTSSIPKSTAWSEIIAADPLYCHLREVFMPEIG